MVLLFEGESMKAQQTRLIPITRWNEFHPWPEIGALRNIRQHCRSNGFAPAFVKIGARVLVNERKFFECVARLNAQRDYGDAA